MQNSSILSNQDKSYIRKLFTDLKIAENYQGEQYNGNYQFDFIELPDTALSIKNRYKSKSAEAIAYFASSPVFADEQTTILHLYSKNYDGGYGYGARVRFSYAKILLQETYDAKYNRSPLVHLIDAYGQTALHHACKSFFLDNIDSNRSVIHQPAMIGMLLAHGADPELKDKYGKIPFDYLQEALSKIDPLILTKLDPNTFAFRALSSAYQNDLNHEKQGQYEEVGKKGLEEEYGVEVVKEKWKLVVYNQHLNLPKHGQVVEQYMNPEQLENITRWQDKVKEVVVPQVLAIPSSAENNSCRVGCVLF